VHRDFWARDLIVIAVSTDQGSLGKVRKMVKDYVTAQNLTFLNLLDPDSKVAVQYGVRGIPMTVFINPEGKVVAFASGYRKWDGKDGRKMLEQILSEG
jgi:peroxiredoxin